MAEVVQIRQILTWIGFVDIQEREAIIINAFESYNDLFALNAKDITSLSESFGRRTVLNGRIVFCSRKTKKLQSLLYWVQDFYRISMTPEIDGLDAATFSDALVTASRREEVLAVTSASLSVAASNQSISGVMEIL